MVPQRFALLRQVGNLLLPQQRLERHQGQAVEVKRRKAKPDGTRRQGPQVERGRAVGTGILGGANQGFPALLAVKVKIRQWALGACKAGRPPPQCGLQSCIFIEPMAALRAARFTQSDQQVAAMRTVELSRNHSRVERVVCHDADIIRALRGGHRGVDAGGLSAVKCIRVLAQTR